VGEEVSRSQMKQGYEGITFWTKLANYGGQLAAMGDVGYDGGAYRGEFRRDLGDYDRPFRPGESQEPPEPPDTYRPGDQR
jgi:hypothetical protein